MKGSAITGPVAKECVRLTVLFTSPIIVNEILTCRRISGRVLLPTLVRWFELSCVVDAYLCVVYELCSLFFYHETMTTDRRREFRRLKKPTTSHVLFFEWIGFLVSW